MWEEYVIGLLQGCHLRSNLSTQSLPHFPPGTQCLGPPGENDKRITFTNPVVQHFQGGSFGAKPTPEFAGGEPEKIFVSGIKTKVAVAPFQADGPGRLVSSRLVGELLSAVGNLQKSDPG